MKNGRKKPVEVVMGTWRQETPEIHLADKGEERTKCDRSIALNITRRPPKHIELTRCAACEVIYALEQLGLESVTR